MTLFKLFRVFKQALHSGGGHLTSKHVEEVSLGVLFLMQAAKKTDRAFKVKAPSMTHTVRDSDKDVTKMVTHLTENFVHIMDHHLDLLIQQRVDGRRLAQPPGLRTHSHDHLKWKQKWQQLRTCKYIKK